MEICFFWVTFKQSSSTACWSHSILQYQLKMSFQPSAGNKEIEQNKNTSVQMWPSFTQDLHQNLREHMSSEWLRLFTNHIRNLFTFGKVSTSKFKAAIGQIWGVRVTLPLAHLSLILLFYIFLHVHKIVHSNGKDSETRAPAEQPSTDFCLTFTI